jgi:DNA-binding XRE family transcriptional regulator
LQNFAQHAILTLAYENGVFHNDLLIVQGSTMATKTPLEAYRAARTLSRGELAKLAEVATSTVWRVERGKHVPLSATRRAIAGALGVAPMVIDWPEESESAS